MRWLLIKLRTFIWRLTARWISVIAKDIITRAVSRALETAPRPPETVIGHISAVHIAIRTFNLERIQKRERMCFCKFRHKSAWYLFSVNEKNGICIYTGAAGERAAGRGLYISLFFLSCLSTMWTGGGGRDYGFRAFCRHLADKQRISANAYVRRIRVPCPASISRDHPLSTFFVSHLSCSLPDLNTFCTRVTISRRKGDVCFVNQQSWLKLPLAHRASPRQERSSSLVNEREKEGNVQRIAWWRHE